MPMDLMKAKTKKGHPYLKIHSHGEVTVADVDAMNKTMMPGAENYDLAIFATVDSNAKFSPEARSAFTRTDNNGAGAPKPVAVVVTSAPLRVMLSFIIRMTSASSHTRFFSNETEAMAFIEEKLG